MSGGGLGGRILGGGGGGVDVLGHHEHAAVAKRIDDGRHTLARRPVTGARQRLADLA